MSFSVATWNVLADAYVRPAYYPRTPAALLDPAWRWPALVSHVERLDADVVCLQEVERPVLDGLAARLGPRGYGFEHSSKAGGKPDGCATFYRRAVFELRSARTLVYADGGCGEPASGHVALVLELERDGRRLGVANTHVKWDPPGTPPSAQRGLRQVAELVREIEGAASCRTWIVCGDLNATAESELVRLLAERGFADPFDRDACTCNANGRRRKIDWIFHTADLVARALPAPRVEDATPLPSPEQPSDHVAIVAAFDRLD